MVDKRVMIVRRIDVMAEDESCCGSCEFLSGDVNSGVVYCALDEMVNAQQLKIKSVAVSGSMWLRPVRCRVCLSAQTLAERK